MRRYKFIGITEYAYNNLDSRDLERLEEMVDSEVAESKYKSIVDQKMMLEMPDGETAHVDFLQIKEVQPKLDLK